MFVNAVRECERLRHFAMMAVLTLLIGYSGVAIGQTATGAITGTITDPKGLAIAGANVLVRNTETGIEKTVVTNDAGLFRADLLKPGTYNVTVTREGFATLQNNNIALVVGQTLTIDMQMPLQSQQSVVTVTSEAPLIETEKTDQSQAIDQDLVANLPISSRSWEQFVALTPGVTPDGATGAVSFHGLSGLYNNNSVDGANNNNSYEGTDRGNGGGSVLTASDGYVYSPDAIREFQVNASGFNAELGQAAGGSVNAVTRSGTNLFHGDLFYYLRYPSWNAIDPVAGLSAAQNNTTATQSVHQQHQYGGSFGGPIIKDKLFFFGNIDEYRKVTPIDFTTSQVTPAIGSPGFKCPLQITTAQCTAANAYILNSVLGDYPRLLPQDIGLLKLDYQLNQANHIDIAGNVRDWNEPINTAFATVNNSGAAFGSGNIVQDRFVIVNWTSLIGNNKVNEFRYQWGVDVSHTESNSPPPETSLSNLFIYGQMGQGPSNYALEHRNQFSDNFSFTRGKHAFKTGVDFNIINDQAQTSTPSNGTYTYSSAVTLPAVLGQANSGCPANTANTIFCDWLADVYAVPLGAQTGQHWTQFQQNKDQRFAGNAPNPQAFLDQFDNNDYAGYFEDTWKVLSTLTLNLGMRYDFQQTPHLSNPNFRTPLLATYTADIPRDFYGGLQPRVGIAWNLTKNSIVRLGGGIFTGKTAGATLKAIRTASGLREQRYICKPTDAICTGLKFPDLLFEQYSVAPAALPLPGAAQPIVLNPGGDNCLNNPSCEVRGISPYAARPRAYEIDATFERQLPGNIAVSAAYNFTRGLYLPNAQDFNLQSNTLTKNYDVVSSATGTGGTTLLTTTVPFFTQRIDPTIGPLYAIFSGVTSTYSSLVLSVRKPMSHGFELLANYTLSKATDDGEGFNSLGSGAANALPTDGVLDPYNLKALGGESYSGADNRHRFTSSLVWQPSFGKDLSNAYVRGILSGWNYSSTITATTGTRYSATVQSGSTQSVSGVSAAGTGMTGSLDTGGGRVAWLPRASFTLPNYTDVDLRVSKQVRITERFNLELRGEAFNLFNSTIVLAVNPVAYTYANAGAAGCVGHTNTCMVPVAGFQQPTITSTQGIGARQLQVGARLNF